MEKKEGGGVVSANSGGGGGSGGGSAHKKKEKKRNKEKSGIGASPGGGGSVGGEMPRSGRHRALDTDDSVNTHKPNHANKTPSRARTAGAASGGDGGGGSGGSGGGGSGGSGGGGGGGGGVRSATDPPQHNSLPTNPLEGMQECEEGAPLVMKEEIVLKDVLGQGACGKVWKGLLRGTIVAIKELKLKYENADQFLGEIAIMTKIRHPNVVLFMGACYDPPYIVTEYLEGGDLQQWIEANKEKQDRKEVVPFKDMLQIAIDISKGMAWLHQFKPQPIIHKDLKPTNVMLDSNGTAKIIDFGLSEVQKHKEMENRQFAGSASWMSPEMLLGRNYTEKIDVYAYGIILWQIVTSSPDVYDITRYQGMSQTAAIQKFIHDIVDLGIRPEIPASFRAANVTITSLIENAWDLDPLVRPSFTQIIDILTSNLLTSVLKDPDAIMMWKNFFPDKDTIPLEHFYYALWQTLYKRGTPKPEEEDTKLKCLDAVVRPNGQKIETVSVERFGLLLYWYGPLHPIAGKHMDMLEKIEELLRRTWYHGEISAGEAEDALKNDLKKGDFLIRCSLNPAAPFVISRLENGKVPVHHRIVYNRTTHTYKMQFQLKKTDEIREISGITLDEFVNETKRTLALKKPVECTKFRNIFIPQSPSSSSSGINYKVFIKS